MPSVFELNNSIDPDDNDFTDLYSSLEGDISSQYYDSNSFNDSKPSSSCKCFSVINLNVNSIGANSDKFLSFLSTLDPKFVVICLIETYLKQGENFITIFSTIKHTNPGGQTEIVEVC